MTIGRHTKLTVTQLEIMDRLVTDTSLVDIGEALCLPMNTVWGSVARLIRRGLVRRHAGREWGGRRGSWAGVYGLTGEGERVVSVWRRGDK